MDSSNMEFNKTAKKVQTILHFDYVKYLVKSNI